ncbi:UNVERIFIED_CONTAM: WPP domain-associated protein [Sesamum calycinum]|uniref:WPP domain-associated protein n=1 Tax=Sesamum calycinum TaxID=2727403 RepID=A0AAW2J786_9LAMI
MSEWTAIIVRVWNGGVEQVNSGYGVEESMKRGRGHLADEVLEDLEEYWEDINDRLMDFTDECGRRAVQKGFKKDWLCAEELIPSRRIFRLEDTNSQLKTFSKMATVLRRTGLTYKQKLERKCADLQMAEAEVDLLGDEVDALLRLLEKIYIALDHYSPVLKHYPGIIEILELVRRELSGESTKLL